MQTMVLTNASATSSAFNWPGGQGMFDAEATWGGGTVKLQMLLCDGSTWFDVGTDVTLTADGYGLFTVGPCQLRVSVATSTAVNARVTEVP